MSTEFSSSPSGRVPLGSSTGIVPTAVLSPESSTDLASSEVPSTLAQAFRDAGIPDARRDKILRAIENVNRPGFRLAPCAVLQLMKPVTWFPPVWAFACGAISTGKNLTENAGILWAGLLLAGPLMCAMSQTMNDTFDRDVDAINEPDRPIPAGLISTSASWVITWTLVVLSFIVSWLIHPYVLVISVLGVLMSFIYSAPPFRAKENGWYGNLVVGLAYEGVAWLTGCIAITQEIPGPETLILALVFSLGAHGIMTLNDFKSIVGDRIKGVRSIPVQLGEKRAAVLACAVMNAAQLTAIIIVALKGAYIYAAIALGLMWIQQPMQQLLIAQPRERAIWYNAFGTLLYVSVMMTTALGVRPE